MMSGRSALDLAVRSLLGFFLLASALVEHTSCKDSSGRGFLKVSMTRGNTMKESYHAWGLLEQELTTRTGAGKRAWTGPRLTALREGARHYFGIDAAPPKHSEVDLQKLLNGTDNPKVLLVWNYRAHWWRLGKWPTGAFEQDPQPNGLHRVALPGGIDLSRARKRQDMIIYGQNRENAAMMRWAKERWGYKIVLFDGQGSGCISSKEAHAKNKTCECGLEMLQIYSEVVDAAFRHYYCPGLKALLPGTPTVIMPLGVHWKHSGTWDYAANLAPSSDRPHDYVFLGSITDASRLQMLQFVSRLAEHPSVRGCGYLSDSKVQVRNRCNQSDALYQKILLESVFCPCPRGVKMESFRMTESLEAGCIPILDDNGTHFNHAWPGIHAHAITTDAAWETASASGVPLHEYIGKLLGDRDALNVRQHDMVMWYHRHKIYKQKQIADVLDSVIPPERSLLKHSGVGKAAVAEAALTPHPESAQCPGGQSQHSDCWELGKTKHDFCAHTGVLGKAFRKHCPVLCNAC